MLEQNQTGGDKTVIRGIERAFMEKDSLLKKRRAKKALEDTPRDTVAAEELIDIAATSHEELISVTTVFPFQLFPDTVAIDRQKVSIIHRTFFRTANVVSVKIGDVLNVESQMGPFFGSIKIYSKYFVDNFHEVKFLARSDVITLHKLLQGYMIATEKEIDCLQIPKEELVVLLKELGHPTDS